MAEEQAFTDFSVELGEDFASTDAWTGEQRPLPDPGEYTLTIINLSRETAKSSGNSMIAVTFEIQDEGKWRGAKVYNNYVLKATTMGRLKQLMVAAGASLDKLQASELMGATILATVYHSEGTAQVDQNGQALPSRTFANVMNERAVEATAPAQTVKQPPVTKAAAKPAAANGAPRRA